MSNIQYPVSVHPKFLRRLKEANTNVAFAQQQVREAQTRLQIAQTHLETLLDLAREIQVDLGQIGENAIIDNFNTGWISPEPQTGPQITPEPTGVAPVVEPEIILAAPKSTAKA